jgi:hypothetical protein
VDHTGVSVSVKGRHFNQTLGWEFCSGQDGAEFVPCIDRTASNDTYTIPLSRFMPDESILLQFQWVHSYVYGDTHIWSHIPMTGIFDRHSSFVGAFHILRTVRWYRYKHLVFFSPTVGICDTRCRNSAVFLYVWMYECQSKLGASYSAQSGMQIYQIHRSQEYSLTFWRRNYFFKF